MKNFENIQLLALANTLISLATAFVLGSIVGFERQYRQRTAGARTSALVAVGAAIFVNSSIPRRRRGWRRARVISCGLGRGLPGLWPRHHARRRQHPRPEHRGRVVGLGRHRRHCAGASLLFRPPAATAFVLAANTLLRRSSATSIASRSTRRPRKYGHRDSRRARLDQRQAAAMGVLEDVLETEQYRCRN